MIRKLTYNSIELVEMVKEGGPEKSKAIAYIFRENHTKALVYLKGKGASEAQADDLLQEGMMILIRQMESDGFEGKNQASVHTYFVGICKNLLRATQRKKVHTMPLEEGQDFVEEASVAHAIEQGEEQQQLHRCLQKLGEICRKILLLRAETPPVPWEELAVEFAYKDAQNAMNKGGKCMKQLRQFYFNLSA